MDFKLNDILDACEEMGLCLVLKCFDNYYYAHSKNCNRWLVHFVVDDEKCSFIEINTEWDCIDGIFLPDKPRILMIKSKEQFKQKINKMLIKLKKVKIQKKKNDIEQDFWEHTYTITGIH